MREGRWRVIDTEAAAAGRWPGADRRRAEQIETTTIEDLAAGRRTYVDGAPVDYDREHIERPEVVTASTAAAEYRITELDDRGRALVLAVAARLGIDTAALADRFYVGRTRRGHIILLTEYELDATGEPVHVLGVPVAHHHLQPVAAAELPEVAR